MKWGDTASQKLKKQLKQQWQQQNKPCALCGQPINYNAPPQTPNALEPDHIIPKKHAPELTHDPNNLQPTHSSCNRTRKTKPPHPPLNNTSKNW